MRERTVIYCCACETEVFARLTSGGEIYPHRPDLRALPFWKCDICKNYVGCHHKTSNRTAPLGCIPTPEIKHARNELHKLIDPLWKSGKAKRQDIYKRISDRVGWDYHTAKIRSIDEARTAYRAAMEVAKQLDNKAECVR